MNIKDFLDEKADRYNSKDFIPDDPVSIPHLFSRREDIEIAGFLTATISWGQRPVILRNSRALLGRMDMDPYTFILQARTGEFKPFRTFVHRTFQGTDCLAFLTALQFLYRKYGSLEPLFRLPASGVGSEPMKEAIIGFREIFTSKFRYSRSVKHVANPGMGASAKRINMFLRWMVRSDDRGVDFGLWKTISPSRLVCPLDVHSGRVARTLGLLRRTANDWKAAAELTDALRNLDRNDPVKYDFALFGLGVAEKF